MMENFALKILACKRSRVVYAVTRFLQFMQIVIRMLHRVKSVGRMHFCWFVPKNMTDLLFCVHIVRTKDVPSKRLQYSGNSSF